MSLVEQGKNGEGLQTLRARVDIIDICNLSCDYCAAKPGRFGGSFLNSKQVEDIFFAAERNGLFEVTLSGGEPTLHPHLPDILKATHSLDKTVVTLVTNGTRVTPQLVDELREAKIGRITVSIDGPDAEMHNSRRGNSFDRAMKGLLELQRTGKRINVASVACRNNYRRLLELSELLAKKGLASEHSICAVYNSGSARESYDEMNLSLAQFYELQSMVDNARQDLLRSGLELHFSNFRAATGKGGKTDEPRTMLLAQWCEQIKNLFVVVLPNGDIRISSAAWGGETVGNQVVGNLTNEEASILFDKVDEIYRSGRVFQLPRPVEAGHKFYIEPNKASKEDTNRLLSATNEELPLVVALTPVLPLSQHELLQQPISLDLIKALSLEINSEPRRWRIAKHSSGVALVFDKRTQHMTVLRPDELDLLIKTLKDHDSIP